MPRIAMPLLSLVLAVANPFGAMAQQPTPATSIPRHSEQIDVRIVNVDVVVTNKAGEIITGLTKEDFELRENKIPQPIVNFYEATPAVYAAAPTATTAAPPGTPPSQNVALPAPRRVIFYIDNLTLTAVERNRVIAEMKEFVAQSMRPRDEVLIATFNRLLRVALPFTDDRRLIEETLDRLTTQSAAGETRMREAAQMQQDIHASGQHQQRIWLAKGYAQSVLNDLQQSTQAVKTLMTNLAGFKGKKAMVVASEGFPIHPGREMFELIDKLGGEVSQRDMIQHRLRNPPTVPAPGSGNQAPPPPPPPMPAMTSMKRSAMTDAREFDAHKLIESIGSAANANGVTLYTIHAGATDGGFASSAERSRAISNSVTMAGRSNAEEGLKSLAELTGGLASVTMSKHQSAFDRIGRDLDSYYSLGYRPAPGEGERTIQVQLKKGGRFNVRSRRTHVQKSPEQEMSDLVVANLLSKPGGNDLKVTVTASEPIPLSDGKVRVPVKIQVPMDSLTFLEQSTGALEGGFDVFIVAADAGGSLSPVVHRTQRVHVAKDQKASAKGTSFTYEVDFRMNREIVRVSVAIVDSTSNVTSFARYER